MRGPKNPKKASRLCACATLRKHFQPVEAPNHIYSRTKFQLSNSITSWDMEPSICY